MKIYGIYDEGLERTEPIGYLLYYEKAEKFIIELCRDLNEWSAPLLFQGLVRRGIYTASNSIAQMWIEERVIPSGRQNIGSILKNHKLQSYNEMTLLCLSKGRCSQDQCYIEEVSFDCIPVEIRERLDKNILECFPAKDGQIICLFKDNAVKKVNLQLLKERYRDVVYVLQNRRLLDSVKVGVGGYSIVFDDSIEVMVDDLRETGQLLPLLSEDFYGFVQRNVVDTTQACEMLQCSRQNLSYLVKEEKIEPIIAGTKANLYTRGAVERVRNE